MKIAFLMLAHKNPEQINRLSSRLLGDNNHIFIHYDLKSSGIERIDDHSRIHVLEDRINVRWGHYSVVDATLRLIEIARSKGDFDYYWLISGEDYPIYPINVIEKRLSDEKCPLYMDVYEPSVKNGTYNYKKRTDLYWPSFVMDMNPLSRTIKLMMVYLTGGWQHTFSIFQRRTWNNIKIYYGSQWWCASDATIDRWMEYLTVKDKGYTNWFRNVLCPDELFFQSLQMHIAGVPINASPVYIEMDGNHPKYQKIDDFNKIIASNKMMLRKVDSVELMNELDAYYYEL